MKSTMQVLAGFAILFGTFAGVEWLARILEPYWPAVMSVAFVTILFLAAKAVRSIFK